MESFCFFHKAQQSSLTVAAITHTTHSLGLQTPFFHQSKKESIWTVNYIHTKQQQQGILLLVKILPQHNHQWMQKWKVNGFEYTERKKILNSKDVWIEFPFDGKKFAMSNMYSAVSYTQLSKCRPNIQNRRREKSGNLPWWYRCWL